MSVVDLSSFQSPLVAPGDMLVQAADGSLGRLALGSKGQLLVVDPAGSGLPLWTPSVLIDATGCLALKSGTAGFFAGGAVVSSSYLLRLALSGTDRFTVDSTGQAAWPAGLGAITHLLGSSDNPLKLATQNNQSISLTPNGTGSINLTANALINSAGEYIATATSTAVAHAVVRATQSQTSAIQSYGGYFENTTPVQDNYSCALLAKGGGQVVNGAAYYHLAIWDTAWGGANGAGNGGGLGLWQNNNGLNTPIVGTIIKTSKESNNANDSASACLIFTRTNAVNLAETLRITSVGALNLGADATVGAQGDIRTPGKVTKYGNVATQGMGVPAIYKYGRVTAQTGTNASIVTYTPTADGSFWCSAQIKVTAYTSGTISPNLTWTDEDNVAQSMTFTFRSGVSATSTTLTATGSYNSYPMHIRVKANTAITVTTTGTFVATYQMEGIITQMA